MSESRSNSWPHGSTFERSTLLLALLSALGLAGVAFAGWATQLILPMTGDRYLLGLMGVHARPPRSFVEMLLSQLPLALIVCFVLSVTGWLAARRVPTPASRQRGLAVWGVGMWLLGLAVLVLYGAAQPWYPIAKLMNLQGGVPFQHRMLFALPAMAWQLALPDRPVLEGYLVSQALALAFALWANYWLACALVQRRFAIAGPGIAFSAWALTQTYFTFYDIAIVGFFAVALRLLLERKFAPYLAVFALATLNHEISLLLVPVAFAIHWREEPWLRQAGLLLAQLAVYAVLRAALFALLPMEAAWQSGKPAFNWLLLSQRTQEVAFAMAPVLGFFLLSLWASRFAPLPLRRAIILWPCLFIMTVSVGQLNEGRQFDAYIPLGMALCVRWIGSWLTSVAAPDGADATA